MSIVTDVPSELKEFARHFDYLCYGHDYNTVFCDFVDYMTAGLLYFGDKELAQRLAKKYDNRYDGFSRMALELIKVNSVKINHDKAWYDALGTLYECITSRFKSSAMGQFFTPPHICDLICQLSEYDEQKTFNDPACGSGRLLLAAKAKNPSGKFYGQDLDPICTKMTAINMAMHGCVGEVSCMDTLKMEWRFGYKVNRLMEGYGIPIPHLEPISCFEHSSFFKSTSVKEEASNHVNDVKVQPIIGVQLSLF